MVWGWDPFWFLGSLCLLVLAGTSSARALARRRATTEAGNGQRMSTGRGALMCIGRRIQKPPQKNRRGSRLTAPSPLLLPPPMRPQPLQSSLLPDRHKSALRRRSPVRSPRRGGGGFYRRRSAMAGGGVLYRPHGQCSIQRQSVMAGGRVTRISAPFPKYLAHNRYRIRVTSNRPASSHLPM